MSRRTRKSRRADGLILGGLMLRRNKDCLLTSWRRQTKSYRRCHSNIFRNCYGTRAKLSAVCGWPGSSVDVTTGSESELREKDRSNDVRDKTRCSAPSNDTSITAVADRPDLKRELWQEFGCCTSVPSDHETRGRPIRPCRAGFLLHLRNIRSSGQYPGSRDQQRP